VFDALNPKLTLWNGSIIITATVAPDGSFEFPKVPPGDYDVSSSRGAQTPLTVAGEDLLGIEIRPIARQSLAATYTPAAAAPPVAGKKVRLHGRVTAPQGELPSTIQLNGNTATLSTTVESNGKFEFPEIAPGVYSVYPAGPNVGFLPRHVVVGARNTGPIDVTIPAIRRVRGRVLIDGEGPLPHAMFRVTPVTSTAAARAFYASDGGFDLTLPVGEYQVDMMRLPAPYRVKSIRYGSADLMRQTLRITDSSPEDIVITLATGPAAPWFRVSGRVTGSDRLPSSPKVILTGEAVRFFIESQIDPSGSFALPKVPPGRYTLRTEPRVYGMTDRTVLIDRDIATLELTAPAQRPLTVRIKMEGGGKRPGFSLSLIHIDGGGFSFAFPSVLTAPLITQRTDFECVSDVCSPPPAGRMLNEPVVVASASTPETFTLRVPEGEYRMAIGRSFEGYRVKSMTFGSVNVLNEFFKVAGEQSPELIVTLGPN